MIISPAKLLLRILCCGVVVLGFSPEQNVHAASGKPSSSSRCTEAGPILSAAIEGEAHRTDSLLWSAPEHPQEVTNSRPPKFVQLTDTSYVWTTDWSGNQPSRDLVRRWLAARYISISQCFPSARSQRRIGDLPGFANYSSIANDKAPPFVIHATAPVFDRSGTYALVYYSTAVKKFFGGRDVFALVRKTPSGWKKVGFRILAVS
jgi:hypothetical protein